MDYKEFLKVSIPHLKWEKIDGSMIKLKNMKRSHLENSYKMCKRNRVDNWTRILSAEIAIRNNEFDEFFEKDNLSDVFNIHVELDDDNFKLKEYQESIGFDMYEGVV